jgi:hypothetical protein
MTSTKHIDNSRTLRPCGPGNGACLPCGLGGHVETARDARALHGRLQDPLT